MYFGQEDEGQLVIDHSPDLDDQHSEFKYIMTVIGNDFKEVHFRLVALHSNM